MNKNMDTNKTNYGVNNIRNVEADKPTTTKGGFADKAGDVLEKVGHKISEVGMPGVGQKIHDLGDSMERTHTDTNHPHDV